MLFMLIEFLRGWCMPFPFWKARLGDRGEYLVKRYFHRRGYHLVARNWRHGHGEIDLIMANYRRLVFLEVKTRSYRPDQRIGDQLSHAQRQRLERLAEVWLAQWPDHRIPWTFQLVLVTVRGPRFSIQQATLR